MDKVTYEFNMNRSDDYGYKFNLPSPRIFESSRGWLDFRHGFKNNFESQKMFKLF